jgi:NAD(P)-dependent dehydrogenase (short-subunit alcohol dehydrogenase family)
MDMGIAGKVAIVTGATRGIGSAVATLLLQEGGSVYGTGRTPQSVAAAKEQFAFAGDRVELAVADAGDPETPARLVVDAVHRFGRLDIVVNNAASLVYKSMDDLMRADWEKLAGEKLVSYSEIMRAAKPHLESSSGAIVNISGVAGSIPAGEAPHVGAVNAGIIAVTRFFASQYAPSGIRVNAVSPGDTNTGRREERIKKAEEQGLSRHEAEAKFAEDIPLSRPVEPAEVAGVVVALCSTSFGSVTGVNVIVDGGKHIRYSAQQ